MTTFRTFIGALLLVLAITIVPGTAVADEDPPQVVQKTDTGVGVKLGLGLGVPYGVLGAGLDVGLPYVSVLGGIGSTIFGGAGWSGGLRAYFLDRTHKFRPHLTAVYGTTAIVMDLSTDNAYTLKGFAFYGSVDHDVGAPAGFVLTYGIGVITHEALPANVSDPGVPIKVLFGVNYRF